jgi:two-component system KDP operon response regulator KdpE
LRVFRDWVPDLVITDLMMPGMSGVDVCRVIRERGSTPVLVLSVREHERSKVEALDAGADDYVTKPFGAAELMARVRVALRHAARVAGAPEAVVEIGEGIRVDLVRRIVEVRGQEIHLTPIEYKLLALLVKHAGMVLTHRQLLEQVWGPGHAHQMQYLRVYMTQLRHKLEKEPARPRHFVTEPGVGYRLRLDG